MVMWMKSRCSEETDERNTKDASPEKNEETQNRAGEPGHVSIQGDSHRCAPLIVSREDQVNRWRRTGTDLPFTGTLNGMRVWREVNLMGEIDVNVETKSPVCWPVISTPVAIAWGRDAGKRAPAAVRWPRVGLVEAYA